MKKNITKIVGGLFIAAMLFFNFVLVSDTSKENKDSFSLKNLTALQASAGEMYCDQSNTATCTIETGGSVGKSTGRLIAIW